MTAKLFLIVWMAAFCLRADELTDLKKENESLKKENAELREQVNGLIQNAKPRVDRKAGIRARYGKDKAIYSEEQLREIEQLYQSANKDLKNPEVKKALAALIEKYPKANRTGCAVQYMGQMSAGEEKEKYLRMAIENFGDCYYGDGVQVGAYARYYLAYYYNEIGKQREANELFEEIRKHYPDAVNHKGRLLVELLP